MKVNFAFHLEIKVPESGGRLKSQNQWWLKFSVKFPQSVMIWAAMSSASVGLLCFLKSTVNAAIYQEILEHFHASFCWQALWRCWFHFPAGLGTFPHCQRYQKLESMGYCPNNADELKATVKETWASIPPQQCHKLITSMPRRIEAVIKAKGAPTKYWVHIQ